jgi:hypothetical protein
MGYMRKDDNSTYGSSNFRVSSSSGQRAVLKSASLNTNYWFADNAVYNNDAGVYELSDPFQVSSSDYASLVGKYTFRDSSHDFSNNIVYYIVGVSGSTMYYLELTNGQTLEDVDTNYAFGDDFTDNGDGTYTLTNPIYIKRSEWVTRYSEAANMFSCSTSNITCNDPYYTMGTTATGYSNYTISKKIVLGKSHNDLELIDTVTIPFYEYKRNYQYYADNGYVFSCGAVDANRVTTTCRANELMLITDASSASWLYSYIQNYYFASSVEWDGSKYNLVDTIGLENYDNVDNLSTHHYFCPSYGQTSCTTVRYIHYRSNSQTNYVTMSGGITTPDELIVQSRANETDSSMKNAVDRWYEHYLIDYTDKLEDSVFCNDRSIKETGGWATDGRIDGRLSFGASSRISVSNVSPSLDCSNPEDAFTVSSENGNGKLTYPVALITADEAALMGRSQVFSEQTWTMSPYDYVTNSANELVAGNTSDGLLNGRSITQSSGYQARPVIVLKNGAFITGGDGTAANPWTVGWD